MRKRKPSQIILSAKWSFPRALTAALLVASCGSPASSREYLVHDAPEYARVASTLVPGDIVTLANGEWKDFQIVLEAHGTADKPVTLRAQTKGAVLITGRSNLRLAGEYLIVSGLVFRDGYSAQADLISFRRKQGVVAHHSRLTEIVIDSFNQPDPEEGENWISLYGQDNRVDHTHIVGKKSRGVTLAVIREDPAAREDRHRIDHNYFGPRPPLGKNGGETIRVGTSDLSRSDSKTVIEDNYFEECDGEAEIISVKSGGNIVRGNMVVASQGAIVLRHGDGNLVERNIIFGKDKAGTGGIRIINAHQTVRDNYIEGVTGTGVYAALSIMNGADGAPLNGYAPVTDTLISGNSVIDSAEIAIGAGADKKRRVAPMRTRFERNLVVGKAHESPFAVLSDVSGLAFTDNLINATAEHMPSGITASAATSLARAANGLLYPTQGFAGAPRNLIPLKRADVGVDWYK